MLITYTVQSLDTDRRLGQPRSRPSVMGHPEVVRKHHSPISVYWARSPTFSKTPTSTATTPPTTCTFYAGTFRTYARHCKRAHFFSDDVSSLLRQPRSTEQLIQLRQAASKSYCGFCVIRPLPTAPIGRTVLRAKVRGRQGHGGNRPHAAPNSRPTCLAWTLRSQVTAYLQQDARVGACAQVAIWTGMRHMHARYGYNWVSVADITRLATPTAPDEATSLPAGSDFLDVRTHAPGNQRGGLSAPLFPPPQYRQAPSCRTWSPASPSSSASTLGRKSATRSP